jgi:hypothetical protein
MAHKAESGYVGTTARAVLAHKCCAVAVEAAHGRARDVIHDSRFGARATLFNAELFPQVTMAPLLNVHSNLGSERLREHENVSSLAKLRQNEF